MSVPFSRPGAVDLSALKSSAPPAGAPSGTGAAGGAVGGAYAVEITAENFQAEMQRSTQLPVAVCFYSPQSAESLELARTLSKLADEFEGRFLLALLDVDANPQIAQSIGVPGVPLFAIALQGQLQPVAQQNVPEADLRQVLNQVVQSAVTNGMTGRVQPRQGVEEPEAEEPEADPKYAEAEEALATGDLDGAIAAYERLLREDPGDQEARTGLARVHLVARTRGVDLAAAREAAAADPGDVEAQIKVADVDLMGGHVEDAFDRLVTTVARVAGDDRDRVRTHLVELFDLVGNDDPRVRTFRTRLASALF
ncbi:MAG TPA: tetratricopeptide repeat protein [Nocardioidaceae bacterium]|nr:tetratricopeptide repeat protein [Nocardioidaceae bacterium]